MADYVSNYSGEQIDEAVGRALPGGALDTGKAPAGFGYGEKMPNIAAKSGESYETFCARIDELLASMPNQVTKQIYAYPPEIYGYGQCAATLFKADGNYAELRCVGNYDNIFEGWRMAKAAGVWKPFEWVNPRMALGVEYRTTERYLGKPVYRKLMNYGAIPDKAASACTHSVANIDKITDVKIIWHYNGETITGNAFFSSGELVAYSWATPLTLTIRSLSSMAVTAEFELAYTKTTD